MRVSFRCSSSASALRGEGRVKRSRRDVRRQLDTGKVDEALSKFEQYERRIDEMEAEADSYSIGRGKNLHDEFADLQAQDEIEKELERMKANLKDKE